MYVEILALKTMSDMSDSLELRTRNTTYRNEISIEPIEKNTQSLKGITRINS